MRAAWFIEKFELVLDCNNYENYSPKSRTPQQPQNVGGNSAMTENSIIFYKWILRKTFGQ